jgi:hypothetical protein
MEQLYRANSQADPSARAAEQTSEFLTFRLGSES